MSAPPDNKGLRRIINALFFSINGMKACFRTEEAFRQEVLMSIVLLPAGFWLGDTTIEKLLLIVF